eukprot:154268_1
MGSDSSKTNSESTIKPRDLYSLGYTFYHCNECDQTPGIANDNDHIVCSKCKAVLKAVDTIQVPAKITLHGDKYLSNQPILFSLILPYSKHTSMTISLVCDAIIAVCHSQYSSHISPNHIYQLHNTSFFGTYATSSHMKLTDYSEVNINRKGVSMHFKQQSLYPPEELKVESKSKSISCTVSGDETDNWWVECEECKAKNPIYEANVERKCLDCDAVMTPIKMITIPFNIKNNNNGLITKHNVATPYSDHTPIKIQTLLCVAVHLSKDMDQNEYSPDKENEIMNRSFVGIPTVDTLNKNLTDFPVDDVVEKGIYIAVDIVYHHKVQGVEITCPHMLKNDGLDDSEQKTNDKTPNCPIYKSLQNHYYVEDYLDHLYEFNHFKVSNHQQKCRYFEKCKAYQRLSNGETRLDDRCHVKLYRHPPRNCSQIKLKEYHAAFTVHSDFCNVHDVHEPNKIFYNKRDGYLIPLIQEVINNGYTNDLCVSCQTGEDCKHDGYSILKVVNNKLRSSRHRKMGYPLNRGEMLSLLLYTGCDCNHNLCETQRNDNFDKWKWFDYCLHSAINKLSKVENGKYRVYTGLTSVQMDKPSLKKCYFKTYMSTSWNKEVARGFAVCGLLIEFDENIRSYQLACDVSWISHFPNEMEVLFARSTSFFHPMDLEIIDDCAHSETQFVSLTQHVMDANDMQLLDDIAKAKGYIGYNGKTIPLAPNTIKKVGAKEYQILPPSDASEI